MHHLVRAFLLSRQADGVSPQTIEWHKESLKKFTNWLDAEGLSQEVGTWDATTLRAYIVYLQGTSLASATVTSKVQSLLAFTRWLHLEEFTETNVGARVKKPKPLQKQPTPFTPTELKALLLAAKEKPRDYAVVCILVDCGVRATELCTLRREDVLLEQGLLKVTGKGNKQRVVPYSALTAKALSKWLALAERSSASANESEIRKKAGASEYVFPGPNGCLATRSLHSLMLRLSKRAGVEHVHPHKFRHTFAVSYLRNGGDPLTLQRLLGHTTLMMTNHYINMSTHDLVEKHQTASPLANLLRR